MDGKHIVRWGEAGIDRKLVQNPLILEDNVFGLILQEGPDYDEAAQTGPGLYH